MEEDLLKILGDPLATYESLGIDGHVLEALQRGDLQTVILSMLLEQNSDPMLATLMQVMLGPDHAALAGSAGRRRSRKGHPAEVLPMVPCRGLRTGGQMHERLSAESP